MSHYRITPTVLSLSVIEYFSLVSRPFICDRIVFNSDSLRFFFICSLSSSDRDSFLDLRPLSIFPSHRLAFIFKSLAPPEMTPDFWNSVPSSDTACEPHRKVHVNHKLVHVQSYHSNSVVLDDLLHNILYLLVFKPLGLIYEVGLRFEFKPPGAYRRNVLILHVICWTRLFAYKPRPIYLNSEYTCTIDDFQGFTYSVSPYKVMYMATLQSTTREMHVYRVIARALLA